MKKKTKKWVITFIILDSLAIICLFLFYGPFTFIKDFLVTNAMSTMSHKYIARTFYTDTMINDVLENNEVIGLTNKIDTSAIKIGEIKEQTTYSSIYEEQILKKDKDNDLYKIITIEEDGYKAFLAVIYDPSRVELVSSSNKGKQKIDEIAKENDAKIAINGSGYLFGPNRTKIPTGAVIMNGKIIYDNDIVGGSNGGIVGFNKDNILVLTTDEPQDAIDKYGMVDAIEFGPFIIINGKMAQFKGDGGLGKAQRTAIAQRQDGIVLMLVSDGRQYSSGIYGMSIKQMANLLLRYGAYNACNLDGGNSSIMYAEGEYISTPSKQEGAGGRNLPNAWIVK